MKPRDFWKDGIVKLTAKARYAVMAMTDIAVYGQGRTVSLSDIAVRENISLSFLEQVFAKLRKAGLVESVRGATGGYQLARPIQKLFIGDIMRAVDEDVQTRRCGDNGLGCATKGAKCLSHDLWQAMEDHIEGFLDAISLKDVLDQRFPALCADMEADTRQVAQ